MAQAIARFEGRPRGPHSSIGRPAASLQFLALFQVHMHMFIAPFTIFTLIYGLRACAKQALALPFYLKCGHGASSLYFYKLKIKIIHLNCRRVYVRLPSFSFLFHYALRYADEY